MFGSGARASVQRTAIVYTPLFIVAVILALLQITGIWWYGPILTFITFILVLLFGYQSIQALRDLRAETKRTRGAVSRIWSKMDLIVTRSYYIRVEKSIFRVPLSVYYDLREEAKRMKSAGTDEDFMIEVEVLHFPHTGTVEAVERLGQVRISDPALPPGLG